MQTQKLTTKIYLCPIAFELGRKIQDTDPQASIGRAVVILLRAAKIITEICPSAPRNLAVRVELKDLMILRELQFPNIWQTKLTSLVCKMHEELSLSSTDKSALSRFGENFLHFQEMLKIYRPDLTLEFPEFLGTSN